MDRTEWVAHGVLIVIAAVVTVLAVVSIAQAGSGGYTQKEEACLQTLGDHLVIAKARLDGRPIEEVKASARHPEPRKTEVMQLVDEAYAAEDPKAWFQERWFDCTGQRI
jgi:hypothetical protein